MRATRPTTSSSGPTGSRRTRRPAATFTCISSTKRKARVPSLRSCGCSILVFQPPDESRRPMSELFAIAKTGGGEEVLFRPALANRHGLITGATGTGKTVTLQMLADHFSRIGVPVFMADVKGDLSGVAAAGSSSPKLKERLQRTGIAEPEWSADPVVFWDVFGKHGFPLRATISDLGPLLLGRLFNLNPTQQGVLALVFKIADDQGLLLLDMKDLRAMLTYVGDKAKEFRTEYGNMSAASIGAIQRALLEVEEQGGDEFFGEPMLIVDD